jgi:hypothetical protein
LAPTNSGQTEQASWGRGRPGSSMERGRDEASWGRGRPSSSVEDGCTRSDGHDRPAARSWRRPIAQQRWARGGRSSSGRQPITGGRSSDRDWDPVAADRGRSQAGRRRQSIARGRGTRSGTRTDRGQGRLGREEERAGREGASRSGRIQGRR